MWRALKAKKLPVAFKEIGRWWGNNPVLRREEEIDLIAYSGSLAMFGEFEHAKNSAKVILVDNDDLFNF